MPPNWFLQLWIGQGGRGGISQGLRFLRQLREIPGRYCGGQWRRPVQKGPVLAEWYESRSRMIAKQVTQALPGQTNRLLATIGDKQALGGYVKVNEWNDYEIIARGGVMMHIMNGQLMAVFIDDNKDSVNNQPGLIGFEIESEPCEISVRDIWLRRVDWRKTGQACLAPTGTRCMGTCPARYLENRRADHGECWQSNCRLALRLFWRCHGMLPHSVRSRPLGR